MRDHSSHIELSRKDAVITMLENCSFRCDTEVIPTLDALGRVLAKDVCSAIVIPNKRSCNMDSVAVHFDDFAEGIPDTSAWQRGEQWEFANTGIAMPDGFDTALAIECVEVETDADGVEHVTFLDAPAERHSGTSAAGSSMQVGDFLAAAGTELSPLMLATVIGAGVDKVEVVDKPRVVFIPTGNELVAPCPEPPLGKKIDSNSALICGKIVEWGGTPIMYDIVPDDRGLIEAAISKAVKEADIVVINAGSSKGSDDWTMEILEEMGTVFCHETNHGPGRHSSYSLVEGTPVVGISGPPMGAAFTTDFYLKPLMDVYLGRKPIPRFVNAVLTVDFDGNELYEEDCAGVEDGWFVPDWTQVPSKRRHFIPGAEGAPANFFGIRTMKVWADREGVLRARPVSWGDGVMEVDEANAYFSLPVGQDVERPRLGDVIRLELRWPYALSR